MTYFCIHLYNMKARYFLPQQKLRKKPRTIRIFVLKTGGTLDFHCSLCAVHKAELHSMEAVYVWIYVNGQGPIVYSYFYSFQLQAGRNMQVHRC